MEPSDQRIEIIQEETLSDDDDDETIVSSTHKN
jgi:hypothetical protein